MANCIKNLQHIHGSCDSINPQRNIFGKSNQKIESSVIAEKEKQAAPNQYIQAKLASIADVIWFV